MANVTQETQVANLANALIATVSGLASIKQQIDLLATEWTNLGAANALNAFPTAALLSTGALGTADVVPSTSHPIDVRTVDGGLLSRAISASTLASVMTYLQGISSAINGSSVTANGSAPSLLAACQ